MRFVLGEEEAVADSLADEEDLPPFLISDVGDRERPTLPDTAIRFLANSRTSALGKGIDPADNEETNAGPGAGADDGDGISYIFFYL